MGLSGHSRPMVRNRFRTSCRIQGSHWALASMKPQRSFGNSSGTSLKSTSAKPPTVGIRNRWKVAPSLTGWL